MLRKWILLCACCAMLMGCGDDNRVAPVVDAWYQKQAASDFYIVREGDTIYSIAFAFGLDYRDLVQANHLIPPYPISPGQRLVMTHRPPAEQVVKPTLVERTKVVVAQTVLQQHEEVVASSGSWHFPTRGRIIEPFSTNPSGHRGISIAGKLGQPVRASEDGTVVYSGDGVRGYGNLIIIKHSDNFLSAYAFNEENLVVVNDKVCAGQQIARMGQNNAGRALLYFEIRHNGVPVDPMQYLESGTH